MDEALLRREIINFTRTKIIKQGMRRINMDLIAREMHISKRTLYVVFNDKQNLLSACISEMKEEYTRKVEDYLAKSSASPFQNLQWLVLEYLQCLYSVDYCFLIDMQQGRELSNGNNEFKHFWLKIIAATLQKCCGNNAVNIGLFTKNLIEIINRSRIDGVPKDEQEGFIDIMLRGITIF